jgi:hypothetical protein
MKSRRMPTALDGSTTSCPLRSRYRNWLGDASSNVNSTGVFPAGTSNVLSRISDKFTGT